MAVRELAIDPEPNNDAHSKKNGQTTRGPRRAQVKNWESRSFHAVAHWTTGVPSRRAKQRPYKLFTVVCRDRCSLSFSSLSSLSFFPAARTRNAPDSDAAATTPARCIYTDAGKKSLHAVPFAFCCDAVQPADVFTRTGRADLLPDRPNVPSSTRPRGTGADCFPDVVRTKTGLRRVDRASGRPAGVRN